MESRRRARNKWKAEDEAEHEIIQLKRLKNLNPGSDEVGPRDIICNENKNENSGTRDSSMELHVKPESPLQDDGQGQDKIATLEKVQIFWSYH